jgi:hypothetical protein
MTNKENAQRIIRHIQNTVKELKELSFGCVVKVLGRATPFITGLYTDASDFYCSLRPHQISIS